MALTIKKQFEMLFVEAFHTLNPMHMFIVELIFVAVEVSLGFSQFNNCEIW